MTIKYITDKLSFNGILPYIPAIILFLFGSIIVFTGADASGISGTKTVDKKKTFFVEPTVSKGFTLMFTGNWQGQIEPCGCTSKQLGGIDRRTKTIKAISPKPENSLMVDCGSLLLDSSRQSELILETFMYAMKQLDYDAIALTPNEIVLLTSALGMEKEDRPPVICTNMSKDARQEYSVLDCIETKIIHDKKTLNCIVCAVSDPKKIKNKRLKDKVKLTDSITAIKKTLGSKGISSDEVSKDKLVVVILPASDEESDIAKSVSGIEAVDIIVVQCVADEPEIVEKSSPALISTGRMGKYIARLEVPSGKENNHQKYAFSAVEIDSHYPLDKTILDMIVDYQDSMQFEEIIKSDDLMPRETLEYGLRFVGNNACQECHEDEYDKWSQFRHSRAMETLENPERIRAFDPSCVVCHTVGMKFDSGYRSRKATPQLANVGCEMCHGPGSEHVAMRKEKEDDSQDYNVDNLFTECEKCHNEYHSPTFQDQKKQYMDKIKHW